MKNIQYFLFAIVLVFSACRKDEIKTDFEFEPTTGGETIETRFSGQVIDEAGLPIINAVVRIAGQEKETNLDGVFSFSNIEIKSGGEMLTIEKSGFFTNIKRVTPTQNTTFQRLGLVAKGLHMGTFASNDGGMVSKPNGEKITFDANTIVDESGNDYTGEVTVYTHHFNPEDPYLGELMPGDLSGINNEGNKVQLATYSMILAELYGESGQKLNLKSGTTAAVEFPIKGSAAANAPAEIPLWSLDELTGVWVEEGRATRDGNYYKADVSHFSFWNCDDFFDLVYLEGQVLDLDGNPVASTTVYLEIINAGLVSYATTNSEGRFIGGVPINEEMVLSILDHCGDAVYTENIGPYSANEQISITVGNTSAFLVLSGSLKDCNAEPISQGYVVAESDFGFKYILSVDANGDFSSLLMICKTNEFSIYGVNEIEVARSSEVIVSYTGQPSEDIGELLTCQSLDEYVAMTFEGNTFLITEGEVVLEPERLRIETGSIDAAGRRIRYFDIQIENQQEGMNIPTYLLTGNNEVNHNYFCADFISPSVPCIGNVTVNITRMDDFIGGYIEGVVEGQLWNGSGTGILEDVTIEFKLKIDFKLIEIGGRVWDDIDQDGIQDSGEPGIPNINLAALIHFRGPWQDPYVYGAITDADGNYTTLMTLDMPGILSIGEIQNGDYIITQQGQGNDLTKDSDFDPVTNRVENVIAIEGGVNQFDCGAYLK